MPVVEPIHAPAPAPVQTHGRSAPADFAVPTPAPQPQPQAVFAPAVPHAPAAPAAMPAASDGCDVIDLPAGDASGEVILGAILRQPGASLIECPVRAPMYDEARLAVGRDRSVVLMAVARQGLADLKSIGSAYRWLIENRYLITMAVPQLAIDPNQPPRLRLLVDQADASAEALRPLLQTGNVTVQAYRKLRWGGRTGLLLDAA